MGKVLEIAKKHNLKVVEDCAQCFGANQFPFKSAEYTNPESVKYDKVVCPHAKGLRAQTVCLFLHPTWEEDHIERCIAGLKAAIEKHIK